MTDLDLDAIRARADAATEGPWYWKNTQQPYLFGKRSRVVMAFKRMGMQWAQPEFRDADGLLMPAGKANINSFPDAEFIAHARSDVPNLLTEVEHLWATFDRIRDALANHPICPICDTHEGGGVECRWEAIVRDVYRAMEATDD